MKRLRAKPWFLLVSMPLIALTLLWARSRWSPRNGNDWLLLSAPVFGARTNAQGVCRTVTFSASNVGPRTLDFKIQWFECRAGANPVPATNRLMGINTPLSFGATTSLTWDLPRVASPDGDMLCCCEILWRGRESILGRFGRALDRSIDTFVSGWSAPWRNEVPVYGDVFASNVRVADYFRLVHSLTRRKWMEEVAQLRSASTNLAERYVGRFPTAEEEFESEARRAFSSFCMQATNAAQQAESGSRKD